MSNFSSPSLNSYYSTLTQLLDSDIRSSPINHDTYYRIQKLAIALQRRGFHCGPFHQLSILQLNANAAYANMYIQYRCSFFLASTRYRVVLYPVSDQSFPSHHTFYGSKDQADYLYYSKQAHFRSTSWLASQVRNPRHSQEGRRNSSRESIFRPKPIHTYLTSLAYLPPAPNTNRMTRHFYKRPTRGSSTASTSHLTLHPGTNKTYFTRLDLMLASTVPETRPCRLALLSERVAL